MYHIQCQKIQTLASWTQYLTFTWGCGFDSLINTHLPKASNHLSQGTLQNTDHFPEETAHTRGNIWHWFHSFTVTKKCVHLAKLVLVFRQHELKPREQQYSTVLFLSPQLQLSNILTKTLQSSPCPTDLTVLGDMSHCSWLLFLTPVSHLLQVFTKILQQELEMNYSALLKVFNHIIMGHICIITRRWSNNIYWSDFANSA